MAVGAIYESESSRYISSLERMNRWIYDMLCYDGRSDSAYSIRGHRCSLRRILDKERGISEENRDDFADVGY